MSELMFRNLDVSPSDPVASWPYEGLVTAIERGSLSDWRRIAVAIAAAPWGAVARSVEDYSRYGDDAVIDLLLARIERARNAARHREEQQVAQRVRQAIARSGLAARDFARECGTSAARLSTYCTGKVQPSAALLVRFERIAGQWEAQP